MAKNKDKKKKSGKKAKLGRLLALAQASGEGGSAFRLVLTDALRALDDPVEMMDRAAALLGQHLGVALVGFAEVDDDGEHAEVHREWNDGRLRPVLGRWRMADFGSPMLRETAAGATVAVADVTQDPRTDLPEVIAAYESLSIRAFVDLGLVRAGRLVAILFLLHPEPRAWAPEEVALIEETAERLWSAVERARAEARLRASEERFRLALEAVDGIVYDYDLRTGLVLRGGRLDLLGYVPEEVPPAPEWWPERIHPEDRARVEAGLEAAGAARAPRHTSEYRVRHRDGHWIDVVDRNVLLYEGGDLVRAIGCTVDATARKAAERALRASESRFRAVFENAGVGVALARLDDRRWLEVNDALCAILGYPRDELLSRSWPEITHPEDLDLDLAQFRRLAAGEIEGYAIEKRNLRKDGGEAWVRLTSSLVRDESGAPHFEIAIHEDISESKAAEAALAESEARFRLRLDAVPQMVWSTGPDGLTDFFNDRWYQFTGAERGSTDGEGWVALCHPQDQSWTLDSWRAAVAAGEPYEAEFRLLHRDGQYRWVLSRALPVRDGSGRVAGWMGTCTDIHEMVEARQALDESRAQVEQANESLEARVAERTAELRQANAQLGAEIERRETVQAALVQAQKLEAVGQLTSGIAHDFNNVIAAIAGGFSVIERRTQDPRLIEVARHGAEAALRGAQLVRQLLAFARQQVLEPRPIDLLALLREAEPLLARAAGERVELRIDCRPDLPALRADPALLETALINLAVNARDAMPEGGTLTVAARASPAGEEGRPPEFAGEAVAIAVTDSGGGMGPEVLTRAAEPFFTTKGQGTGLGLAMVQGFVQQAGGALRLDSREGVGTTVTLYLPQAGEAAETPAPSEPVRAGREASVLLVDDDASVRAIVAAQLADLGHRVIEAGDAQGAIEALEAQDIDLMLSDVAMPGVDGLALAALVRERWPGLPVLFMTGQADRARLQGEAVLDKPFAPGDLARRIDAMLAPRALSAGDGPVLDRLAGRLRSARLRALLAQWRAARGRAALPRFEAFDPAASGAPQEVVVGEIDADDGLRFRFALGSAPAIPPGPAGLEAGWRRCAETAEPVHEYARIALGDGGLATFERLLLPWSTDGRGADRLVGLIVLNGAPRPEGRDAGAGA